MLGEARRSARSEGVHIRIVGISKPGKVVAARWRGGGWGLASVGEICNCHCFAWLGRGPGVWIFYPIILFWRRVCTVRMGGLGATGCEVGMVGMGRIRRGLEAALHTYS